MIRHSLHTHNTDIIWYFALPSDMTFCLCSHCLCSHCFCSHCFCSQYLCFQLALPGEKICFDQNYNFKWYFALTHARDMILVRYRFQSKIWFWPGIWLWPSSHKIRFCSHMIRFFHKLDDIWLSPVMWYLTHRRDMILLWLGYDVTPTKTSLWTLTKIWCESNKRWKNTICTHLGYDFVLSCGARFWFHQRSDSAPTRKMISYLTLIRLISHSRYDLGLNRDMILLKQTC